MATTYQNFTKSTGYNSGSVLNLTNPLNAAYDKYGLDGVNILLQDIERRIFDLAPPAFDPMKIINMLPFEEKNGLEFHYRESVWFRTPLNVATWTHGTKTLKFGAAGGSNTINYVHLPYRTNTIVYDANERLWTIKTVTQDAAELTIVVEPMYDGQLATSSPTSVYTATSTDFTAGDPLIVHGQGMADGMTEIAAGGRIQTIDRFNFHEWFQQSESWTEFELNQIKNNAATDSLDYQKEEKIRQLRLDMFSAIFGGRRGRLTIFKPSDTSATPYPTFSMNGILNMMIDGGSEHSPVTYNSLKSVFKHHAYSTAINGDGSTRYIFATAETLGAMSDMWKNQNNTRYAPNDRMAALELNQYKIGELNYVPVPTDLFRREAGVLAPVWENRILVLDTSKMSRTRIRNWNWLRAGQTDGVMQGSETSIRKWWVDCIFSMKMNNVKSSFYLDIVG